MYYRIYILLVESIVLLSIVITYKTMLPTISHADAFSYFYFSFLLPIVISSYVSNTDIIMM